MMIITAVLMISTTISLTLVVLSTLIGKTILISREKLTPFECGFDPSKKARTPFSLRFFMITILFLIFDVELVLMLPLGLLMEHSNPFLILCAGMVLIHLICLGLLHEWNQGALAWAT
uniref:NADH-ubiquinone oxidoreductase chain 3 n=1 Tax=Gammarus fossarum TaxID=52638 RepID=A0A343CZQ4_9CRUS|nr:NADH dehydrogenase subunit 3 [Gammarus fossarum]ARQ82004.1 NADH dehydrogenase subunit 3 [Gammarus fossarum]